MNMETQLEEINANIKHEPEEQLEVIVTVANSTSQPKETQHRNELLDNIKHEPEECFEFVLPAAPEVGKRYSQSRGVISDNVKREPEEHFELVLPNVRHTSGTPSQSTATEPVKKSLNHTHSKKFSSGICGTCKQRFSDLESHQRNQQHGAYKTKPVVKIDCNLCKSSFGTETSLKRHKRTVHGKLNCHSDVCGKTSPNLFKIRRHMQIHQKAACPICQRTLASHRMNYHIKQHSDITPFKCKMCKKDFASIRYLTKHIRRVHEVKEIQCDFCNKIFKNKTLFKTHVLNHAKIPCTTCGKPINKILMQQHVKVNHLSNALLLCCNFGCRNKFRDSNEVKRHHEIHIAKRRFKCPQCNYEANGLQEIQRHMKFKSH